MRTINRRGFLGAAAGSLALTALTACGGSGGDSADAATRTVQGFEGPVEVPVHPERVVCVDHYTPGALLDVGVRPTAVAQFDESQLLAEYLDIYRELPKVGASIKADPEQVLTHDPDLILGTYLPHAPDPNKDRFAEIAPTVLFAAVDAGDWKRRAIDAADAVGKRAEAEALQRRYTDRANAIATEFHDVFARTRWSMVMGTSNTATWHLALPGSWSGIVVADAGVRFSNISHEAGTGGGLSTTKEYSMELVDVLRDSDVILIQGDNTGRPAAKVRALLANPAWSRLPAVQSGHAVPLPYFTTLHYGQGLEVLETVASVARSL
ncbi:ABC transporter substrate-binding protein [Nocardia callitridis]|uniref:Fe/B12 periplasmic-binding domain-containing protein n=1 Tax=Nocardia callitridis TaxID=648753 RepID=A0ABP9KGT2_9NOCA